MERIGKVILYLIKHWVKSSDDSVRAFVVFPRPPQLLDGWIFSFRHFKYSLDQTIINLEDENKKVKKICESDHQERRYSILKQWALMTSFIKSTHYQSPLQPSHNILRLTTIFGHRIFLIGSIDFCYHLPSHSCKIPLLNIRFRVGYGMNVSSGEELVVDVKTLGSEASCVTLLPWNKEHTID